MTTDGSPAPTPAARADEAPKASVLAKVAIAVALVGAVVGIALLTLVPAIAVPVGLLLPPLAFVLAIVSLFRRSTRKSVGVAAIIVSAVAATAFVVYFFATYAQAAYVG
ncbi:hypothetical protein [Microbacterium hominis]|uniref:Uncharacterized protein n=1 Tax=Microbacterium hominis TaxID=162426 RepID=A0A7D4PV56_9MICO|nr:hypothetical protein [Microbacterium hominis]QKJ20253.1 hypothetical protein HQM25_13390 [Microbacterium hominis]